MPLSLSLMPPETLGTMLTQTLVTLWQKISLDFAETATGCFGSWAAS